jgi:hypothetical protein
MACGNPMLYENRRNIVPVITTKLHWIVLKMTTHNTIIMTVHNKPYGFVKIHQTDSDEGGIMLPKRKMAII